jgi:hypothetical protein
MKLFIIFGIIIILVIFLVYILNRWKKIKETISIENKYDVYAKVLEKHMYVKELIINDKTYLINKKLNQEQINKMVYYLIVPDNNENIKIADIIIRYLEFIEFPDLIESENRISNYYGLIEALHELTGKDGNEVLSMKKKEFISLLKN